MQKQTNWNNLNSHSWGITDSLFQILWVWLVPPDYTQLNQEHYVEIWRSICIQKIKIIQNAFSKILQTCYFDYFGHDYCSFNLELSWRSICIQKIKKILQTTSEKLQIYYPMYSWHDRERLSTLIKEVNPLSASASVALI